MIERYVLKDKNGRYFDYVDFNITFVTHDKDKAKIFDDKDYAERFNKIYLHNEFTAERMEE